MFLDHLYSTRECKKTLVCTPEEGALLNLTVLAPSETSASRPMRKLISVVYKPLNLWYCAIAPGGVNELHQVILMSVSSSR